MKSEQSGSKPKSHAYNVGVRERSSLANNNNVTCTVARGRTKRTNIKREWEIEPNIHYE
jgi:hypothetical protein